MCGDKIVVKGSSCFPLEIVGYQFTLDLMGRSEGVHVTSQLTVPLIYLSLMSLINTNFPTSINHVNRVTVGL